MEQIRCPECESEISASANFCTHCGASVQSISADWNAIRTAALASTVRAIGAEVGRDIARNALKSVLAGRGASSGEKPSAMVPQSTPQIPLPKPAKSSLENLIVSARAWAVKTGADEPQLNIDEDAGSASYSFGLTSDEGEYECYLDVHVEPLSYVIYTYSAVQVPDDKLESVKAWLATLNEDDNAELELIGDENRLRCVMVNALKSPEFAADDVSEKLSHAVSRLDQGTAEVRKLLIGKQKRGTKDSGVTQPVAQPENGSNQEQDQGESKMRLTDVLQQWLTQEEWEEQPEVGEDGTSSSTGFGYGLGDFSLKCWFDVNETGEIFKIFMYYRDSKVPEKRLDEIRTLVTDYAPQMYSGTIHLLSDSRTIRYFNAIDVEGASFEPAHISGLLRAGGSTMSDFLPRFMAVCFGGKTAAEAMED